MFCCFQSVEIVKMNITDLDSITSSWWPVWISLFISVIGAIRVYAAGPKCPEHIKMEGKTVLITGASSGIGLAVATELAMRGATVILTCRHLEKGKQAVKYIKSIHPAAKIDLKELDMSRLSKIRQFVQELEDSYEKLDVLINNAAIIFQQYEKTEENFEQTFATNYLGPFLLTHLLLPFLKRSNSGRIINVSANAHYSATLDLENLNFCKEFLYRQVFGQTKLALTMFSIYFGEKLQQHCGVTVNAVNPGIVRGTDHLGKSPLNSSWMTRISVYPWTWLFLKSPKQGAQTVVFAAVDPSLKNVSGKYLSDCEFKEAADETKDKEKLAVLYKKSCELCNLNTNDFNDLQ